MKDLLMTKDRLLELSAIESLLSQIAETIYNTYSPTDLNISISKYHQIVKNLNEIEKILQEARS